MSGSVTIWATSDGVRVNPETGRYFEDRTDIHKDYPTGDYQLRNAVWDADEGRVLLRAARNEFVAFQVIVESDKPLKGAQLRFSELTGPGGAKLNGRNVALFKAWYVEVKQPSSGYEKTSLGPGWYPDALIPGPTGEPLSFDLPDERNGLGARQRNQTLWVDIYVPRDREQAPPGTYRGELVVLWPGGESRIAVQLEVWDFSLPDEIHCKGDIYNNSLQHMDPDLEMRYYQMCRRHRFQPGVARYAPQLMVKGTQVTIDWTDYDARVGRYLDGSAFTEENGYWGPGVGLPISHLLLPFDCEKAGRQTGGWPLNVPPEGPTPEYEAVWVETGRQIRAHFDADPNWRRVRKIVFMDGLDESYYEEAYRRMIYYCDLLRRGMGTGWFSFRVDGGYSSEAMEKLHPYVDLWVCHTIAFDAEKMAHFREKGVEPWFYGPMIYEQEANSACGSNTFLDLDLLTCRGLGWAAWKHKCGWCEWEFEWEGLKGWTEALNWVTEHVEYNGSGLLIYRGDFIGSPGPVPSIRLKALRRGLQDYEYFAIGDSVFKAVPFGRQSVGNTEIWRNNPDAWDEARTKAGELLAGR